MWDTGLALPQRTASSIKLTVLQSQPISAAIPVGPRSGGADPTAEWSAQQVQVRYCGAQGPLSWNSLFPAIWGIIKVLRHSSKISPV